VGSTRFRITATGFVEAKAACNIRCGAVVRLLRLHIIDTLRWTSLLTIASLYAIVERQSRRVDWDEGNCGSHFQKTIVLDLLRHWPQKRLVRKITSDVDSATPTFGMKGRVQLRDGALCSLPGLQSAIIRRASRLKDDILGRDMLMRRALVAGLVSHCAAAHQALWSSTIDTYLANSVKSATTPSC
jgi:hypothetical protein